MYEQILVVQMVILILIWLISYYYCFNYIIYQMIFKWAVISTSCIDIIVSLSLLIIISLLYSLILHLLISILFCSFYFPISFFSIFYFYLIILHSFIIYFSLFHCFLYSIQIISESNYLHFLFMITEDLSMVYMFITIVL